MLQEEGPSTVPTTPCRGTCPKHRRAVIIQGLFMSPNRRSLDLNPLLVDHHLFTLRLMTGILQNVGPPPIRLWGSRYATGTLRRPPFREIRIHIIIPPLVDWFWPMTMMRNSLQDGSGMRNAVWQRWRIHSTIVLDLHAALSLLLPVEYLFMKTEGVLETSARRVSNLFFLGKCCYLAFNFFGQILGKVRFPLRTLFHLFFLYMLDSLFGRPKDLVFFKYGDIISM